MNTKVIIKQLLALVLSLGLCSFQSSKDCDCPKNTSGTFSVYDYEEIPELSPAPEGFRPFYISHFGRHGARYCTSEYDTLYDLLLKAEQKKLLTDEGRDFFTRYDAFYQNVRYFKGNLSDIGRDQLKAIADHMFNRFPEVFEGPTVINASSTESARVIMSMWACLSQLQALDSDIVLDAKASASFATWLQPVLSSNPYYYNNAFKCGSVAEAAAKEYFLKTVPWKKIVARYFVSPDALSEQLKVSPDKFIDVLASIVFGAECLNDDVDCFDDVFSPEEKSQICKGLSAKYFISNARFKDTKRISVDYAAFTLAQMIDTAQDDMESGQTNLRLRFSHDSSIAPLIAFLDINGCGRETDSLEESLEIFPSCNIPMGASVQLVFYKNQDGKILLRALLNEREAELPLSPYSGSFYSWEDFKAYYSPLIEASVQKIKNEKTLSQAEWNWKSIGDGGAFAGHADVVLFGANQSISVLRYRADKFKTFIANDCGERADSTSALALRYGGIAAINASFFSKTRYPVTFVKDDGIQEGFTTMKETSRVDGIVGVKGNKIDIIPCDTVEYRKVTKKYKEAIASGPIILLDGREARRSWPNTSFYMKRHPRTFIGTTADGWTYLVVIDGRFPQGIGTTIHETAEVARMLGLQDALNLDGGGSSVLWTKEYGTISHPYDNRRYDHFGQRVIPNIIYIK